MKFEYTLYNGTVIDNSKGDMTGIHEYYEAACTGEYLQDMYDFTDNQALVLGYEVRRRMNKYEYSDEGETVDNVMSDFKDKVVDWLFEHEQASKDFCHHFGIIGEDVSGVDISDIVDWIAVHQTLKEDFDRAFERFV